MSMVNQPHLTLNESSSYCDFPDVLHYNSQEPQVMWPTVGYIECVFDWVSLLADVPLKYIA